MKLYFRQSMAWLHTWASLVIGWLLFFVFVTGTASCFMHDVTRWMEPERPLEPGSSQAPRAVQAEWALDFLARHAPGANKWEIKLVHARNQPDNGTSRTLLIARAFPGGLHWELDPLTGHELSPLVNALTTDRHLGVTLPAGDWALAGFDLTMWALAAMFAAMAFKLRLKWRPPGPLPAPALEGAA